MGPSHHRYCGSQQTVVGPDEVAPVRLGGNGAARRADPGVDDSHGDAVGDVLHSTQQRQRSPANVPRPDAVSDVDHPDLRGDPGDDAVDHADELVGQPEVTQERDGP